MSLTLDEVLQQLARQAEAPFEVAEVALLLARDEYPQLDVEAHLAELDAMAREARHYVRGTLPARLHGLCRYLFHEMGFRGNVQNYYDPANSYFNMVLERRTGIPITLTAVVQAMGQRVGLAVEGVGLPGHFIAQVREGEELLLFDPFHGGRPLTEWDCENLVQQITGQEFTLTAAVLQPLPLGLMVLRMLNNLKAIYLGEGDFQRGTRILRRLGQLQPDNPLHLRDLGAALVQAGQFGSAIDQLQAYLIARPNAGDAEQVQSLLRQAEREIARWN